MKIPRSTRLTERMSVAALKKPVVLLSPHLDDGILSCGHLLAANPGAVVLTVFAGTPVRSDVLTTWDRSCGFTLGDDVMATRKSEDSLAASEVGATTIWMDHLDSQYLTSPLSPSTLADELERALHDLGARTVLMPIGLAHPDHQIVREASLAVLAQHSSARWFVYGDLPYLYGEGGRRDVRSVLRSQFREFRLTPVLSAPKTDKKEAALSHYQTQRRGIGESSFQLAVSGTERYWRIRGRRRRGERVKGRQEL